MADALQDLLAAQQLVDQVQSSGLAGVLEQATVHVLCAPEDEAGVRAWVDGQRNSWLYRVRVNPFVSPGVAYAWQLDGVLAPAAVTPVVRR